MARFTFRLEKLLEYRRLQEKWAKDAYLETLARQRDVQSQVEATERRRETAFLSHPSGLDSRRSLDAYFTRLDDEQRGLEAALAVVNDDVENALGEYRAAMRETASIEKLRAKRHDEWLLDESRREQAELDEWSSQRRAS